MHVLITSLAATPRNNSLCDTGLQTAFSKVSLVSAPNRAAEDTAPTCPALAQGADDYRADMSELVNAWDGIRDHFTPTCKWSDTSITSLTTGTS
jgi:hypothetical protein